MPVVSNTSPILSLAAIQQLTLWAHPGKSYGIEACGGVGCPATSQTRRKYPIGKISHALVAARGGHLYRGQLISVHFGGSRRAVNHFHDYNDALKATGLKKWWRKSSKDSR